jgi:hypothetical protein
MNSDQISNHILLNSESSSGVFAELRYADSLFHCISSYLRFSFHIFIHFFFLIIVCLNTEMLIQELTL